MLNFRDSFFLRSIGRQTKRKGQNVFLHDGDLFTHYGRQIFLPVSDAVEPDPRWLHLGIEPSLIQYDFSAARWAVLHDNAFTMDKVELGKPLRLSDQDRAFCAVAKRFSEARCFSREENEASAEAMEKNGIPLPPVLHVTTAWNFGDGAYGDILLTKAEGEGWREVLAHLEHDQREKEKKGVGPAQDITFAFHYYGASLVQSRPARAHEQTGEQASPEREMIVRRYYINDSFLPAFRRGGAQAFVFASFPGAFSERLPARLEALLLGKKNRGAVLGLSSGGRLFVPFEAKPFGPVGVALKVRVDKAGEVKASSWYDLEPAAEKKASPEEMASVEPLLQRYILSEEANPYRRVRCAFSLAVK